MPYSLVITVGYIQLLSMPHFYFIVNRKKEHVLETGMVPYRHLSPFNRVALARRKKNISEDYFLLNYD